MIYNEDGVITVVLKVRDKQLADKIIEAHLNNTKVQGCTVKSITLGDVLEDRNAYEEYIYEYLQDFIPDRLKGTILEFDDWLEAYMIGKTRSQFKAVK